MSPVKEKQEWDLPALYETCLSSLLSHFRPVSNNNPPPWSQVNSGWRSIEALWWVFLSSPQLADGKKLGLAAETAHLLRLFPAVIWIEARLWRWTRRAKNTGNSSQPSRRSAAKDPNRFLSASRAIYQIHQSWTRLRLLCLHHYLSCVWTKTQATEETAGLQCDLIQIHDCVHSWMI